MELTAELGYTTLLVIRQALLIIEPVEPWAEVGLCGGSYWLDGADCARNVRLYSRALVTVCVRSERTSTLTATTGGTR
jgi:hypothetical protein